MSNLGTQRIGRTMRDSEPRWEEPESAPRGAPNILVIVTDDMGYSDIGPYGSEIPTPHLDQLARRGTIFSNYHSAPLCSPARAALLTAINPHRVGYAGVANFDLGFPNTAVEMPEDVATLPHHLRANGYATFAVGKWHLTREGLLHDGASRKGYPLDWGFDHFYGSMEGLNSFFHPNRLMIDNSVVEIDDRGDDYYLTDDLTDQAISYLRSHRASSARPFLLYFCHQAMHGPLGAKSEDLLRHRGRYDQGWDVTRAERFRRQLKSGLLPSPTTLPSKESRDEHRVQAWEQLSNDERERHARYMEVYAAMVDSVDQSLGRILETLDALGDLDNTIVVFTSDNGGTSEGGPNGTRSYFSQFLKIPGLPDTWDRDVARDLELVGGPQVMPHYPRGWARVSNTPFRLYKGNTYAGGVRVPLIVSWPGVSEPTYRHQFQYVTDIAPTLLELAGVQPVTEINGKAARVVDGISFAKTLRDPSSKPVRTEQYAECGGERGYYRDGWKILTNHIPGTPYEDAEWRLYDVVNDPAETVDLSEELPDKRAQMAQAWEAAATRNQVFPLDSGDGYRWVAKRPSDIDMIRETRILPGTFTLERYLSAALISLRSFSVDIDLTQHHGAEGTLIKHGDQGGGYLLYVQAGRLKFAYNAFGRMFEEDVASMPEGSGVLTMRAEAKPDFYWQFGFAWSPDPASNEYTSHTLSHDERLSVPMLLSMAPWSGIDVGVSRGGPVDWDLYKSRRTFPYRGTLRSVVYRPGERAPYDPAVLHELATNAADVLD